MSDIQDLKAENARLAARVADLESQLAAKPVIDRASLFRMVNNAPWGVMTISSEGRAEFSNQTIAPWLRDPPTMGLPVAETLIPTLYRPLETPVADALAGRKSALDLRVADASGKTREIHVSVEPRGEPANGAILTLLDVTDTNAVDRAVRENEARLAHINAINPSVIYIFDFEAGSPVWAAGRTEEVYGFSTEAMVAGGRQLSMSLIHPDDLPKVTERLRDLAAHPDGHVSEFELRIRRRDGGYRWLLDRAVAFERTPDGRIAKTLSAAIDIDERKRAEDRRKLLINELNHRVKNTLAAVQSIARQTLRGGRSAEQTIEQFTARLVALSAAHDVLTRENWEGAALREIVAGALAPFSLGQDRVVIEGPEVRLPARTALGLAMALHELATNALKHGALSGEEGVVRIGWSASGDRLDLEWRESGGPPTAAPDHGGFGVRLLTQGLPAELGGTVELDFDPVGVVCRIAASLAARPSAPD